MQSLLLSSVAPFPRNSLDGHQPRYQPPSHRSHQHYPRPSPSLNWTAQPRRRPDSDQPSVTSTSTSTSTTTSATRPGLRAPPLPSPYLSPPMSRSPPPPSENHLDSTSLRGSGSGAGSGTLPLSESNTTTSTTTTTTSSTATSTTTPTTSTATPPTASSTNSTSHHEPPPPPILPPPGDRPPSQRWTDLRRDRDHDRPQVQAQAQAPSQSLEQTHVQPQVPSRLTAGSHLPDPQQPPPQAAPPPVQVENPAPGPAPAAGALASSPVEAVYLPLAPLATSLPPRTTRRAKAHVPSACVNCKHKHLGCDSERPCRRCVASGKEATCKDVTHKKRGRPPLRAEESLMRHFETPFGLPDPSREPRVQMSPPMARPNQQHRRTSSSREIRPMTELRFPRPGDPPPPEHLRPGGGGMPPHAPLWGTSAISSSPMTRPMSSQGDPVASRRPFSSGSSHQSTQPPPSPFFHSSPGGRPPRQHPSPAGRPPQLPPYLGFGPPVAQPPQPPQQQPPLPAPFTPYNRPGPRSPHRPAISEPAGPSSQTPRDLGTRPHSAESPSDFRLPPIRSSPSTSGVDPVQQQRRPGEIPPPPPQPSTRTSYEQAPSQTRPREQSDPYPQPLQPAFQATSAPPARPMTANQLPTPLPSAALPPLSMASQPLEPQPTARESGNTTTTASGSQDGETEGGSRPAKRRKMALGDMVNK